VGDGLCITSSGVLSVNAASIPVLNLIVYTKQDASGLVEIWTSKYDGTNQSKISLTLPAGTRIDPDKTPRLSPDGLKVFFTGETTGQTGQDIYMANINSSGLTKIISGGGNSLDLGGAF